MQVYQADISIRSVPTCEYNTEVENPYHTRITHKSTNVVWSYINTQFPHDQHYSSVKSYLTDLEKQRLGVKVILLRILDLQPNSLWTDLQASSMAHLNAEISMHIYTDKMCTPPLTASPWQAHPCVKLRNIWFANGPHYGVGRVMPGTASAVMAVTLTGICAIHAILEIVPG